MSFKNYLLHLKLLEVVPKNHEEGGWGGKRSCSVKWMELCDDVRFPMPVGSSALTPSAVCIGQYVYSAA